LPLPHQLQNHSQSDPDFNLPPNFQTPIPTSWLVFACPLENVTAYAEAADTQSSTSATSASDLSGRRRFLDSGEAKAGKKIYKRRDFDFSHNGLPVFEFSSRAGGGFAADDGRECELPPFLEVGEIGPFYDGDGYEFYSDVSVEAKIRGGQEETMQKVVGVGMTEKGIECPYKGQWWKVFYEQLAADAARWDRIRAAMSRGKCRIVVRYTAFESESESESEGIAMAIDTEAEGIFDVGLGIGGLQSGSAGPGERKKIKERLVGRQRLTRSETRRRSGLGMTEVASNRAAVGIGASGAGTRGAKLKGKK
jgi:hypothetical protein